MLLADFPIGPGEWTYIVIAGSSMLLALTGLWLARRQGQHSRDVRGRGVWASGIVLCCIAVVATHPDVQSTQAVGMQQAAEPENSPTEAWSFNLSHPENAREVIGVGGGLLVRFDRGVAVYDPKTGREKWRYFTPALETWVAVDSYRKSILLNYPQDDAGGFEVANVDAETGSVNTRTQVDGNAAPVQWGSVSRLQMAKDNILSFGGGDEVFLRAWSRSTLNEAWRWEGIDGCAPSAQDPTDARSSAAYMADSLFLPFLCTSDGNSWRIVSLDSSAGDVQWKADLQVDDTDTYSIPRLYVDGDGRRIFVSAGTKDVAVLDATSGDEIQRYEGGEGEYAVVSGANGVGDVLVKIEEDRLEISPSGLFDDSGTARVNVAGVDAEQLVSSGIWTGNGLFWMSSDSELQYVPVEGESESFDLGEGEGYGVDVVGGVAVVAENRDGRIVELSGFA
ncbi:PQQ-binding-like beta-propeller repeat protein [Nocardiopsis suaedae]|uniref:Pyrrolo-quinoline quinone n=1 Tax=Nocardiopsis suaedae TaxID=3018444 RepID=A0ABT4TEV4_9ACTN|nr:hypothetical protein [Nocardiopsis suaedae]MDA2803244.1 hypothetical protein [Nocardiopsis suaedae]